MRAKAMPSKRNSATNVEQEHSNVKDFIDGIRVEGAIGAGEVGVS